MVNLKQAEELVSSGKYEQAVALLTEHSNERCLKRPRKQDLTQKPKIDSLLWAAYEEMGLFAQALPYAESIYTHNPSMINTKRYFELLFKMGDYSTAQEVLRVDWRFHNEEFVKWRKEKEEEVSDSVSSQCSLTSLEPSIVARILSLIKDRALLRKCLQLNKALSHHKSTHYPIKMRERKKEILALTWKCQSLTIETLDKWGLIPFLPLKRLVLCNCYGIDSVKLPYLEDLELSNCHLRSWDVTGLQRIEMFNSEFSSLRGDLNNLVSLKMCPSSCINMPLKWKLPAVKHINLEWGPSFLDQLPILFDRTSKLEHLKLSVVDSLSPSIFGGHVLSKLKRLELKTRSQTAMNINDWNRIMASLKRLTWLSVGNLIITSVEPAELKLPPQLSSLQFSSFKLSDNVKFTLPKGMDDVSFKSVDGLVMRMQPMSRL